MAKLSDLLRQQTQMNLPNDSPLQPSVATAGNTANDTATNTANKRVENTTSTAVSTKTPTNVSAPKRQGGVKISFDSLEYFNNVLSEKNNKFSTKPVYIREEYAALLSKLSSMSGLSMKVILDNVLEPILSKGGEFSIGEHIISMMKDDIKNQF